MVCAADIIPVAVLISGQLQVSRWWLPVSVSFANFSSQDGHKTHGTPAAVHSNPALSTFLYHTWEDNQPQSGCGLVAPYRKCSHMVQKNQKALGCLCFCSSYGLVSSGLSCKMWLLCCYKNQLSEADVIVGGRCHMLGVKDLHSHATLTRNDVKIALLPLCQSCRGWKHVTLWRKRDPDYLMIRPLHFTNRIVCEM